MLLFFFFDTGLCAYLMVQEVTSELISTFYLNLIRNFLSTVYGISEAINCY